MISPFDLFEKMIAIAKQEIFVFTQQQSLYISEKIDKTLVTACDEHIDKVLSEYAKKEGFSVVSEEGEHSLQTVQSGNYLTIDPIDGSLGYIDHVQFAVENGGIETFLQRDLGPTHDFCLLLGIVENGIPQYACCYHYVTGEIILLDANHPEKNYIENQCRMRNYENACYMDQRKGEILQENLLKNNDTKGIVQATLGLKSLYTFLNPHKNAITIHRVQKAGLWDILPAAVAHQIYGGLLLDDTGNPVEFTKYVILPGNGATAIKGEKYQYITSVLS